MLIAEQILIDGYLPDCSPLRPEEIYLGECLYNMLSLVLQDRAKARSTRFSWQECRDIAEDYSLASLILDEQLTNESRNRVALFLRGVSLEASKAFQEIPFTHPKGIERAVGFVLEIYDAVVGLEEDNG